MPEFSLSDGTTFRVDSAAVHLIRVGRLVATNADAQSWASLVADTRLIEGPEWRLASHTSERDSATFLLRSPDDRFEIESRWTSCAQTRVVERSDSLLNRGPDPAQIRSFRSVLALPPDDYEAYIQSSRWAHENQGDWIPLQAGTLELGGEAGRTCQGATPFVCVRPRHGLAGLAFHLLPRGNWAIWLRLHHRMFSRCASLSIESGQAERLLNLSLEPGARWDGPRHLMTPLPDGRPESAAAGVQRFALDHILQAPRRDIPVVFNTWLDRFDDLEVDRLRAHLQVAAEVGCETFVVDAGWFGDGINWFDHVGDWTECDTRAFRGRMRAFADEVRAVGLQFGLWMEPERCTALSRHRTERPSLFVPGTARFALERPEVEEHLHRIIGDLIARYEVAWLKVDFNFELGPDPTGTELRAYSDAWTHLIDRLRAEHPATLFEGCASGGMRLDMETLRHWDGHFLTDSCNAWDTLRIKQGLALRLPPTRTTQWLALQCRFTPSVASPFGSGTQWLTTNPSSLQPRTEGEWIDPDFAALAAMPSLFGLSGDIASWPAEDRPRLAQHVTFQKTWRSFLARAHTHLLLPVRPITDRTGWAAFQCCAPHHPTSLLFVFRLQDSREQNLIPLRELEPKATYRLTPHPPSDGSCERSGESLMQGFEVHLDRPASARAFVVERVT